MKKVSDEKSKRAKARWAMLRNVLLQGKQGVVATEATIATNSENPRSSSSNNEKQQHGANENSLIDVRNVCTEDNSNDNNDMYSIHRFQGFQVLNRRVIKVDHDLCTTNNDNSHKDSTCRENVSTTTTSTDAASAAIDKGRHNNNNGQEEYEYIEYEIPIGNIKHCNRNENGQKHNDAVKVRTREKKQNKTNKKINIKDLMSHVHYGVDNTGNTRVWECSTILAHLVTCQSPPSPPSLSSTSSSSSSSSSLKPSPFIGLTNIKSLAQHPRHVNNNHDNKKRLRIIELGSGMAALPSLSLAAVAFQHKTQKINTNINNTGAACADMPFLDIMITDGHPNSVENNLICSKLTCGMYDYDIDNDYQVEEKEKRKHDDDDNDNDNDDKNYNIIENKNKERMMIQSKTCCSIQSRLLLWKASNEGSKECLSLLNYQNCDDDDECNGDDNDNSNKDYFDLVLVSDCTHFIEFHAGLIATIGRLLRVGGICILCQPRRGNSLNQFIELIHVLNGKKDENAIHNDDKSMSLAETAASTLVRPLFDFNLYCDYNEQISKQHKENLERDDKVYDENIHYPLVLELKKIREYDERVDTALASKHVRERDMNR